MGMLDKFEAVRCIGEEMRKKGGELRGGGLPLALGLKRPREVHYHLVELVEYCGL